jgi:hypothetical protein
MPQLLYKEVGADLVPQLMLWSIPQLSDNEVEVERCFNCLKNGVGEDTLKILLPTNTDDDNQRMLLFQWCIYCFLAVSIPLVQFMKHEAN